MTNEPIRTVAPPQFTEAGRDVLAFHLHRYLAHWLAKHEIKRVWVTVGFEHGFVGDFTTEVGQRTSAAFDAPWRFEDLADSYNRGLSTFTVEGLDDGAPRPLHSIPLREESSDGVPALLGFVVAEGPDALPADAAAELEVHTGEAIRAARRNGVRLFFDECDERDMKRLLYAVLDRLPEWTGCDVAAAVVLSNSLQAMSLDHASEAQFYVMAERLFVTAPNDEPTRFVGMSIDTRDEVRTVVDAALEHLSDQDTPRIAKFVRHDGGYIDRNDEPAESIGRAGGRPDDAASFVVPLVTRDEEPELIGFLCLAFSGVRGVPGSVEDTLEQLADELAGMLRYSPLYTLSTSKLQLIRAVRQSIEHALTSANSTIAERRDNIIADVIEHVQQSTEVPAFSVGWLRHDGNGRTLVYPTSFGWSDFDSIELDVDISPDALGDSGVSTLAARLNRPVTLAGGRQQGDHQEFKNYLWVNEPEGEIIDERAPAGAAIDRQTWRRLGEYYKPARDGAYATVAHPIAFDGHPLGVLALEVDRTTNWNWWAGYASQRLWEMISSELAFAFWYLEQSS